jgi:hypothetical protein
MTGAYQQVLFWIGFLSGIGCSPSTAKKKIEEEVEGRAANRCGH